MPLGLQPRLFRPQRRAPAAVPGDRRARDANRREAKCMNVFATASAAKRSAPMRFSRRCPGRCSPRPIPKARTSCGTISARTPLLELEALACSAKCCRRIGRVTIAATLPIGVDGKPGAQRLRIGETIRGIAAPNSWAVLKNIEQVPAYARCWPSCSASSSRDRRQDRAACCKTEGFVFVSSPGR
jgi:hypothetical protein